jgi:CTP:molybdopterin cytidylyltransferase MocA
VTVAAIVPAAGRGERLGPGEPKALRTLAGVPMLVYAVQALARARLVELVELPRLKRCSRCMISGRRCWSSQAVSTDKTRWPAR